MGLQVCALKQTEPDCDLVHPRGVGRQPADLEVESPATGGWLLTQPAVELFRRMRGAMVQNQRPCLHLPPPCLGNELLLQQGLEVDKAFALTTGAGDLALGQRVSPANTSSSLSMGMGYHIWR